ncbi:MAG: potassium-transporting ATPase subunit F [Brevundimonas sp.]|nr:MAG: potassium-transporting ATPase subunit F [Brevundimonas sp.]
MARLRASGALSDLHKVGGVGNVRSDLSGVGRRSIPALRRPRRCIEEDVTMIVSILWGVGAVVVAGYMVAALVRPERF